MSASDTPDPQAGQPDDRALAREWRSALTEQTGDQSPLPPDWAKMIGGEAGHPMVDIGGDRVLNQEEIDQTMGFVAQQAAVGGAGGVRAIADSGRVSHERLPMLEIIFDRIVRLLSSTLRSFFSDNVEVTLGGITSVRFGDYLNSIPLPALLAIVRAEGWGNFALMTVEPSLAYSTLDLLLGGRRFSAAGTPDARAFTSIEVRLIRRMVQVVLGEIQSAFKSLSPVEFIVERIESNPRFAVITRPANAAILIGLRVDMEGRGGMIRMVLPYATIEPIRDLLLQSFMGEKLGRDPIWESHFATEVWQSNIPVRAVLHEMKMPLRRALALEVGDTIMFGKRPDSMVTLRCGDMEMTRGRVGRIRDKVAIQIAKPLRKSRTTLATFEAAATLQKDK